MLNTTTLRDRRTWPSLAQMGFGRSEAYRRFLIIEQQMQKQQPVDVVKRLRGEKS